MDKSNSPTEVEQTMATLWSEVLQIPEQPKVDDDFFALGGDSMSMVTLECRIYEEFSVELPAGTLLSAPTLRELSAKVDAERRRMDAASEPNADASNS